MGRLTLYADTRGRTVVHEEGFSLGAVLVLPVWALQRHLWGVALLSAAAVAAGGVPGWGAMQGVYAGVALTAGFVANRYHRWALGRSGWRAVAVERDAVTARNGP